GKYLEAARANVAAVRADERQTRSGADTFYMIGYYGHNLHFLAIANAFAGNSREAIAAANKLYAVEAPRIREVPPVDGFLCTRSPRKMRSHTTSRPPGTFRRAMRSAWRSCASAITPQRSRSTATSSSCIRRAAAPCSVCEQRSSHRSATAKPRQ